VFACALVGFIWARLGRPFDRNLISTLISEIGAPCLVFSRLVALDVEPAALVEVGLASLLAMVAFGTVAFAVLRLARLPSHTFLPPMMFANAGNMGLPLCLFAFGDEGLALAVCFFAATALVHFTVGVWIWSGESSPAVLLRTPLAWAVTAAAVVIATGVELPKWLLDTTGLLGGFTIPLMLLMLGASLSDLAISSYRRTVALSALRLGMGFGVGVALAAALGLDGVARGVVIIQCSMPPAVFNYLFAERYGRSPGDVASIVVASTLLTFATLPFVLAFVLSP